LELNKVELCLISIALKQAAILQCKDINTIGIAHEISYLRMESLTIKQRYQQRGGDAKNKRAAALQQHERDAKREAKRITCKKTGMKTESFTG
jgi:hypothetical protein